MVFPINNTRAVNVTKGVPMFVELMSLLAVRTGLITVTKVEDKTLRVNVISQVRPTTNQLSARPLRPGKDHRGRR